MVPPSNNLSLDPPCGQVKVGTLFCSQRASKAVRVGFGEPLSWIWPPHFNISNQAQFEDNWNHQTRQRDLDGGTFNAQIPPMSSKVRNSMLISLATTDPGSPVLLPPRASQVYAYLLSQEQVELTRGADASWERLMHVRHLKDRMISEPYERSLLSRVCFNSGHMRQGNAGAWLVSALVLARRPNSALSSLLRILLSRHVRSRGESEQPNN
jgi:hypothetical protein